MLQCSPSCSHQSDWAPHEPAPMAWRLLTTSLNLPIRSEPFLQPDFALETKEIYMYIVKISSHPLLSIAIHSP